MKKTRGWISEANLQCFLKILADECKYKFDQLDNDAIDAGIEDDKTFNYKFVGAEGEIRLGIFREGGASTLEVSLQVPDEKLDRIGMLYHISQHCFLSV